MNSTELRSSFLEFFQARGHALVVSSPLVPKDDPTLLFTSAGMVQFKKLYSGTVPLPYRRACSCQKCFRASDLDMVGTSPRHLTFLEMLGNFSFGDYFKKEAIEWAWEYLTQVVGVDKERLHISVFKDDDDAYRIWNKHMKIDGERIVRLGEEDNFWGPAGGTGACGPSSEIHYDLGVDRGCGSPACAPGCNCNRWIEVWNLVFPQFDQQPDGTRLDLENRGIDTGLGLERLAMVLQDATTVFETDLFLPLKKELERISGEHASQEIEVGPETRTRAMEIIVDHVRALAFTLAEGTIPSNEGRGYVLRRLLRRALRQGQLLLGGNEPFLYRLVGVVSNTMGNVYPELMARRDEVALIVKSEEEKFLSTLQRGMNMFSRLTEELKDQKEKVIPGEEVFKLYDTYGFPLDLTRELAEEAGLGLDLAGFEEAMEQQKRRAQNGDYFEDSSLGETWKTYAEAAPSEFTGYESTEAEARVIQWRRHGELVEVVLDRTPFYGEAGGQKGDTGYITGPDFRVTVEDTRRLEGLTVHIGRIEEGEISDQPIRVVVDTERRRAIARAHTGTHLLHYALRTVLGETTRQEGSFVQEDRFRFDFNSLKPLSSEQLRKIEEVVNEKIRDRHPVEVLTMSREDAASMGAIALFGEKYGEKVRVVKIGNFSIELCGGTHLTNSSHVCLFKLVKEEPVAAGIRRLEALTGREAYEFTVQQESLLRKIGSMLKAPLADLDERVSKMLDERREIETEIRRLQSLAVRYLADELLQKSVQLKEFTSVVARVNLNSSEHLRLVVDRLRDRAGAKLLGVLASSIEGRAKFIAFAGDDVKSLCPASSIAKEIARMVGGGGGGRPTIAEAGGKDPDSIDQTLSMIGEWIEKKLDG